MLASSNGSLVRPLVALTALLALGACSREAKPQPTYYWPAPTAQPTQANGGTTPAAAAPAAAPTAVVATPTNPTTTRAPAPSANDPVNLHEIGFLRRRAEQILGELVTVLAPAQAARVQGIPLVVDATPGEVNAFATCSGTRAAMAITDGLLQIESQLARARAHDEIFGGNKVGEYIALIARSAQPKRPLPEVPAGFIDAARDLDPRKVARQYQVLDEQIAFVLGHELAHHYLGHLPCVSSGGLNLGDINVLLTTAVPAFNQPNEVAADVSGLNNTLNLGARRTDYHLTEGGALLTMQFFAGLDELTPVGVLFAFEQSHPLPQVRTPILQQTAAAWRATGGRGLPIAF